MTGPGDEGAAVFAAAIERLLADGIPEVADVPAASLDLVEGIRNLVEAAVRTDVDAEVRAEAAQLVSQATKLLQAATNDAVVRFARTPGGRIDQLTQAGSGMLNPQAPRLVFRDSPDMATKAFAADAEPKSVEVVADCTLSAAHSGPPGRAHGGVVATLLDHVLGLAASAAGVPGFTAGLDVRYRAATPYDVPLEVRARWTHCEGRKSFATGEILAGGRVTAEATAVFIAPPAMRTLWSQGGESASEDGEAGVDGADAADTVRT
ncbi:PaaI family thioesterase [Yinghuangia soli]|uniref:Acyl-coenzyme A thioesterase THEM4 n=1 Tax=Yinghuangia soli TaxID=2908204 RepID=A0AA41Q8A9_9ACTN|nr:PaaI family thioesterase [Yinghuangia soli]MCF2533455.1 PaaI family thioesterase [Yinghuangia soli]